MRKRKLGDTSLHISELTLGTWGLAGAYGPMSESLIQSTVEAALEEGVDTFDVAPLWGDMEQVIGKVLAEHEAKQAPEAAASSASGTPLPLAPKAPSPSAPPSVRPQRGTADAQIPRPNFGAPRPGSVRPPPPPPPGVAGPKKDGSKPPEPPAASTHVITRGGARIVGDKLLHRFDDDSLREDCERSLEKLGRKSIDVWLLHDPPEADLHSGKVFDLAKDLVAEGKVRVWGVSTAQSEVAELALRGGAKAVCLPYHLLAAEDLEDLREAIEENKAGVLARSPLCHGLLSGRWTEYRRFAQDDHRAHRWRAEALAMRVRQVNQLRFLVTGEITSLSSAALRFVLGSELVTSAVVGARRPVQIRGLSGLVGEPPYLPEEARERVQQVLTAAGA